MVRRINLPDFYSYITIGFTFSMSIEYENLKSIGSLDLVGCDVVYYNYNVFKVGKYTIQPVRVSLVLYHFGLQKTSETRHVVN